MGYSTQKTRVPILFWLEERDAKLRCEFISENSECCEDHLLSKGLEIHRELSRWLGRGGGVLSFGKSILRR